MNNRKQTNKRGVNPRQYKIQIVSEAKTLKSTDVKTKEIIETPNPNFGLFKKIKHLNF